MAAATLPAADEKLEERRMDREDRKERRSPPVDTYVNREGWQSGIGYKEMERYVKRLSHVCSKRLPGMVFGIAGGKRGILLQVTFRAQRSFYMARENTEEFLKAIVADLERMPEPVAAAVYVTHNKREIIRAERKGKKIVVKFLL